MPLDLIKTYEESARRKLLRRRQWQRLPAATTSRNRRQSAWASVIASRRIIRERRELSRGTRRRWCTCNGTNAPRRTHTSHFGCDNATAWYFQRDTIFLFKAETSREVRKMLKRKYVVKTVSRNIENAIFAVIKLDCCYRKVILEIWII